MISYKTFRLLNNASIVEFVEISTADLNDIVSATTKSSLQGFSFYVTADRKVLLADSIEESGAYLFNSLDDIVRMRETGIKSTTIVTTFWPEPRTFESATGGEIDRLINTLNLERKKVDYSEVSLHYIEKVMHEKQFKFVQQVLDLYLGILAYAGEHLIRKYNGKWFLEIEDETRFSSWEPKIKLQSGKIIDPFVSLFDGLQLRKGGKFIPIISLHIGK